MLLYGASLREDSSSMAGQCSGGSSAGRAVASGNRGPQFKFPSTTWNIFSTEYDLEKPTWRKKTLEMAQTVNTLFFQLAQMYQYRKWKFYIKSIA